jgi:hypothetical protein
MQNHKDILKILQCTFPLLFSKSLTPGRNRNFPLCHESRPALQPNQPPILWVPGTLSPEAKQPGHEADHSLPSKIKNVWNYTSTYSCLHSVILKHRDKFTSSLLIWSTPYFEVGSRIDCYDMKSGKYRICACTSRIFLTRIYPPKLGCGLCTEYDVILTTEPATPILYVLKLPVETASVWDCYLASYCTRENAPTYYQCIGIFWLHESSWHHQLKEVGRPWRHWQITINAASDNQSAANAIGNIFLSHR